MAISPAERNFNVVPCRVFRHSNAMAQSSIGTEFNYTGDAGRGFPVDNEPRRIMRSMAEPHAFNRRGHRHGGHEQRQGS